MSQTEDKQKINLDDLKNGPVSQNQRECRDVICCILFLINVAALVYCVFIAYMYGNPSDVFRATDKFGNICGQSKTVTADYPYAFFYNPLLGLSNRVCVKECPGFGTGALSIIDCYGMNCNYGFTISSSGVLSLNPSLGLGVLSALQVIGYQTSPAIGRVCIPSSVVLSTAFSVVSTLLSSVLSQSLIASIIMDIMNIWKYLLAAIGLSIVMSFIIILLFKLFVGIIVWASIIGLVVLLIGIGLMFLYNGGLLGTLSSLTGTVTSLTGSVTSLTGTSAVTSVISTTNYQYLGYIVFVIVAIIVLLTICCYGRIKLAVAICKTAGGFITTVPQTILVPVIMSIIIVAFWAFVLVVIVFLMGAASYKAVSGDIFSSIGNYADQKLIYLYYFIFGSLWTNAIMGALTVFVIASACCMWYYSHGPGCQLDSPIMKSFYMGLRYHLGSLAFGSLILAFVQFFQLIVQIFKRQAQTSGVDKAVAFSYIINCVRCCLACVERIVQFINKSAYIQIALRGKNFCMAAADGFELVWSNALRYSAVNGIGEIIMLIGKLMITAATVAVFYAYITFDATASASVRVPIVMLVIVGVVSFGVSMVFMSVYSLAMDALLACFIVDQINQKAQGNKGAMYAPEQLQKIMDQ